MLMTLLFMIWFFKCNIGILYNRFSFGEGKYNNPFIGWGNFFVDNRDENDMGLIYSNFIFHLSFATTATTIVSGAMAERTKLSAYIIFSFLNTMVYCVPAHWTWATKGTESHVFISKQFKLVCYVPTYWTWPAKDIEPYSHF